MTLLQEWLHWWDEWNDSPNPTEYFDPPVEETRDYLAKQYDPVDPMRSYKETLFEMSIHVYDAYVNANQVAANYGEISDGEADLIEVVEMEGRTGLMELAIRWTDEFQEIHKDREWDGEWWEEIDAFVKAKLAPNEEEE